MHCIGFNEKQKIPHCRNTSKIQQGDITEKLLKVALNTKMNHKTMNIVFDFVYVRWSNLKPYNIDQAN